MQSVLFFENEKYLSSKEAAKAAGFTNDYISKLCRLQKLEGRKVGNAWYVKETSLKYFLKEAEQERRERQRALSKDRKKEYKTEHQISTPVVPKTASSSEWYIFSVITTLFAILAVGSLVFLGPVPSGGPTDQSIAIHSSTPNEERNEAAFDIQEVLPENTVLQLAQSATLLDTTYDLVTNSFRNAFSQVQVVTRSLTDFFSNNENQRQVAQGDRETQSTPQTDTEDQNPQVSIATSSSGSVSQLSINTNVSVRENLVTEGAATIGGTADVNGSLIVEGLAQLNGLLQANQGIVTNNSDINAGTGNVFASNIVNSITAGNSRIRIEGTSQDVIISALGGGGGGGGDTIINNIGATTFLGLTDTISSFNTGRILFESGSAVTDSSDLTFATSTLTVPILAVSSSTATSTFANGIELSGGCFELPDGSCLGLGTGITSLNGLTSASQSFATGTDANITLTITSTSSTHTITPGFTGQLSVARGGTGSSTPSQFLFGDGAGGLVSTSTISQNFLDNAVILESDIDTYSELNTLVADQTLTHSGLIDTSSEIAAIVTDETGVGQLVFGTLPTLQGFLSTASSTVGGDFTVTGTFRTNTLTSNGGATTTVTGGLQASGLASSNGLTISSGGLSYQGGATSSFNNGLNISSGCFSVNGACVAGEGIQSLNGLTSPNQTFATGTDANITLTIDSSGSTHTLTPGFTGQLSVARGGTGSTTPTGFLFGDGAGALNATSTISEIYIDPAIARDSELHDAVTLAGALDYLTLSGQEITRNAIDLTTDVSGTLPVANGGTGATSLTDGGILFGSGTGAITASAVLGNGELLIGDGSGDPTVATLTDGTGITITEGAGSITIASTLGTDIDLTSEVTGILPVANGGTGSSTPSGLLFGDGAGGLVSTSTLSIFQGGTGLSTTPTFGQILVGQSDGTYALAATSTLGLFGALSDIPLTEGFTLVGDPSGTASATSTLFVSQTGNVGIGTTSPFTALSVGGDAYLGGNVTATGTLNVQGQLSASSTATSTFANGIALESGCFRLPNGECAISSAEAGITALGPTGETQTGSTITFASTTVDSSTGLSSGLTITGSGDTITFDTSLTGTLSVGSGGTGSTTPTGFLFGDGAGALNATSTISEIYIDPAIARDSELHDAVTLAGALDYLTLSGQEITRNAIDLTTDVSGTLPVANGGTGATSLTDGGILFGSGTGAITASAVLGNGELLIGDGSGDPTVATLTDGTGITITEGAGSITIASTLGTDIDLTSEVTGILPVANGGTGSSTPSGLLFGDGAGGLVSTSTLSIFQGGTGLSTTPTFGQILVGQSDGTYALAATSTLGLFGALSDIPLTEGFTLVGDPSGTASATSTLFVSQTGNVGIGTTSPFTALSVGGDAYLGGNVTATGTLNVQGQLSASSTATSTFANGIALESGCFRLPNGECAISSAEAGITALGPTGETQTGSTITFASTTVDSSTGLSSGLTITGSGDTITFDTSLTGTLSVGSGGTGSTTPTGFLFGDGAGALNATSTISEIYIDPAIARDSELHDAVTLAGALDYLTLSGQEITRNAIDLTTDVSGTLPVANGGTGATSLTDGGILFGSGTGAITASAVLGNGELLIGDGSGDPTVATLTDGTGITITEGAGSITIASTLGTDIDLTSEVTGILPVANGGTGSSTPSGLLFGDGAGGLVSTSTLSIFQGGTGLSTTPTFGQILVGQSDGTYALAATSTLGLFGALSDIPLTEGFTLVGDPSGTASATSTLFVSQTGNVGIGTTSPFTALSVGGDAYLGGNVTATGTLNVQGQLSASSTATSTFANGIALESGCFRLPNGECAISSAEAGITALGPTGETQTGSTITFASTTVDSSTGLSSGLTITGSGDTITFDTSLTGTLSVGSGGTGSTTPTGFLFGDGAGALNATSTISEIYIDPAIARDSELHDAVTLAGALDYLTLSGQEITRNAIDLTTDVSGTLPVANGGTGATSLTDGGILFGSGTGAITASAVLGNGELLIGDGSGDPTVATLTDGTGITITEGAGSITIASTLGTDIDLTSEVTGILPVANGGTGSSTPSGLLFGDGAGGLVSTSTLSIFQGGTGLSTTPTFGQILVGQSDGTYALAATSTLGLFGALSDIPLTEGFTLVGDPSGTASATSTLFVSQTGNVGIGTTSPFTALSVGGDAYLGGNVTATGTLNVQGQLSASSTATSTFANGIALESGCFRLPNGECAISSAEAGITALGPTGETQTGSTITFASTTVDSSTGLSSGLTITGSGDTITFDTSLTGTLSVGSGGTGSTTPTGFLFGDGAGALNATSTISEIYIDPAIARDSELHDAVTLAGALDYLTLSGQEITRNAIDLTTDVSGTLPVANGGTGATSLTDGGILFGSGTGAITASAVLGNGELLIGDGSGDPTVATLTDGTGITITEGAGSITIASTLGTDIDLTSEVTGILPVANGGTGSSTPSGLLFGDGAGGLVSTSTLSIFQGGTGLSTTPTFGQILVGQSDGTYALAATSTLGLFGALSDIPLTEGFTLVGDPSGTASATSTLFVSQTGNVGIGTTSPFTALSVGGDAYLGGNVTATGTLAVEGTGTSTVIGGLSVNTGGTASGIKLPTDICSGVQNGGVLTTDSNGYIICEVDDGGAGGGADEYTDLIDTPGSHTASAVIFTNSAGSTLTASSTFVFNDQGRLGIGTSTPSTLLTVGSSTPTQVSGYRDAFFAGSVEIDETLYVDGSATSTFVGGLSINTGGSESGIKLPADICSGVQNGGVLTTDSSGYIICEPDDGGAGGGVSTYLELTDTPSSFTADAIPYTNTAGTALLHGGLTFDGSNLETGSVTATSTTATSTLPNTSITNLAIGGDYLTDLVGTGLEVSGSTLTTTIGTDIDLTSEVTGILPVANGGTGSSTPSGLLFGDGAGGLVSTSTLSIFQGGTGLSTTPTFGQILVGQSDGTYALQATSTLGLGDNTFLGLSDTPSTFTANALSFVNGAGDALTQSSSLVFDGTNLGVGTSSPFAKLSVHANNGETNTRLFEIASSTASATSTLFVVTNEGDVGVGTTSPTQQLSVSDLLYVGGTGTSTFETNLEILGALQVGDSSLYLDTDSIENLTGTLGIQSGGGIVRFGDTSNSTLTLDYAAAATSTIVDNNQYAWTFATSTTATPIISIDTSGTDLEGQATTTINGGFVLDSGAVTHDYGSGVTSVDNLELGNLSFEENAGVVSWIDLPVTTTVAGVTQSYSAKLDGTPILTIYGVTDGSGTVENTGVALGTSTPYSQFTIWDATSTAGTLLNVIDQSSSTLFSVLDNGNVGVGTSSPTSLFTVDGASYFAGVLNTHGQISASSTATSTFAQGISIDAGCFEVNGTCIDASGGGSTTYLGLTDTQGSFTADRIPFTNSGATALTDSAFLVFDGTNLGVGTSTPFTALSVGGDAYLGGNVTATGTLNVQGQLSASSTATSTFANGIALESGCFRLPNGECAISSAEAGITALGPTGETQTGSTITFASTTVDSSTGLSSGLTITGSGDTITFDTSLTGTLSVGSGGTGSTTPTGFLFGDGAGALNATSTISEIYIDPAIARDSELHDAVTLAGALDYLTLSGQEITRNAIDLTTDVSGTLPVANGGTGATSLTDGGILFGSGTGAITASAVLGNGELLIGDGSGDPTVATLTDGTGITITEGAGSITIASTLGTDIDLTSEVTGILPVANGGTGSSTPSGLLFGDGAGGLVSTSTLSIFQGGTGLSTTPTFGQILVGQSDGTYALAATSTLGLFGALSDIPLTEGFTLVGDPSGTASATSTLFVSQTGNVGIGTTSPFTALSVGGDAYLGGNVTATGTLNVQGQLSASSTATSTFANGIALESGCFRLPNGECAISSAEAGITALGPTGETQTGSTITFASTTVDSSTGLSSGLTITGSGDTITFDTSLTGTLSVGSGGTGSTTPTGFLFGDGAGALNATSTISEIYIDPAIARDSELHDAVTLAGALDYLTLSGQEITRNAIDLTTDVSGTLPVANGGTGATSLTDGGILFGSGTGAITASAVLGNGELLIGDGSGDPTVATLTDGTGITITEGAGSITIASTLGTDIDLTSEVTGILPVANGGTGSSTPSGLLFGDGAGGLVSTSTLSIFQGGTGLSTTPTFGQILVGQSDGTYALAATSTLGLFGALSDIPLTEGFTLVGDPSGTASATSTLFVSQTGNVGIGTTSPFTKLSVHANNGETNTRLFEIASSTASATSTLFVVTNEGNVGVGTSTPQDKLSLLGGSFFQAGGDITSSSTPVLLSDTGGIGNAPDEIYVLGNYAYIADVGVADSLHIVDVTNPRAPSVVGSIDTGGGPDVVSVSGRYAYVGSQESDDLKVIDVSNPTSPTTVGSVGFLSNPNTLVHSGNFVYMISDVADAMYIIDVSDPRNPVETAEVSVTAFHDPYGLYVAGRYAYIADDTGDLQIVDISDPYNPVNAANSNIGTNFRGVHVVGRYAYLIDDGEDNLRIVDVSDPTSPSSVATIGVGSSPQNIFVSGRYAYVTDISANDLKVIDVSVASSPKLIGSVGIGNNPADIFISGRYAYVTDNSDDDLKIYDISGIEVQAALVHSLEAGSAQVEDNLSVGNLLNVVGALSVGSGGINSSGQLSVSLAKSTGNTAAFFDGNVGISTTTPYAKLSLTGTAGQANPLFQIASSTEAPLFTIHPNGQLSASSTATSTFANGIALESGCFRLPNGECAISSAEAGITALGPTGETQTGSTITFASTTVDSSTGLSSGLTITGSGDTITFDTSLTGTLSVGSGGTGSTTPTGFLFGDGAGALNATSTISEIYIDPAIARDSELHDAVTLAGALDYLTLSGQEITRNAIDLTTDVSGTLPVANGGTGATSLTDGGILFGSGTGAITASAVLGNGELLIGDGSGDPTVATLTDGTGITITEGAGSITIASTLGTDIDLTSEVTGILPVANGGTGSSTPSGLLFGDGAGGLVSTSTLSIFQGGTGLSTTPTFGQILVGQSDGTYALQATSTLGLGDGANNYGPTVIVAASNSSSTERAHFTADGTDDEVEIQAAIDSLPSVGGTVLLLEGTFNVGTTTSSGDAIVMATSTILRGSGTNTVLRVPDSTNGDINVIAARNIDEVVIRDLKIDGNKANQSTGTHHGIFFFGVASSTVDTVTVSSLFTDGIHLTDTSYNVIVSNSSVSNSEDDGISIRSGSGRNIVLNSYVYGSGDDGIGLSSSVSENRIIGNEVVQNLNNIVFSNDANFNVVEGNIVKNALQRGVYVAGGDNNVINDNEILNNRTFGIDLSSTATNNSISGNAIYNNGGGGNASIFVNSGDYNLINDNQIIATGTAALIELDDSGSEGNIIANNYYSNSELNDANFISDSGTGTRYDDYNRVTLETGAEVGYNLLSIIGSSSVPLASTTQLGTGVALSVTQQGTGDVLNIFDGVSEVFTILDGGNVGVGTSSPTSLFTVDGASYFAGVLNTHGQISASSTATSTFAQGINLDAGCFAIAGTCLDTAGGGSGVVGSGTLGQIPYYAASGDTLTATSSVFVAGSGNVGIGNISPNEKLNVQGEVAAQIFTATSTTATSTFPRVTISNLSIGSDYLTDLVGTGLVVSGSTLTTTLGTDIDLTSEVTGILPVANGGTGSSTPSRFLFGDGAGNLTSTSSIAQNFLDSSVILVSEIDTYSELNTLVSDQTLTHNGLIDSSSELSSIVTDETGSGQLVFATNPTLQGFVSNASSTVNGDLTVTAAFTLGADSITDITGDGLTVTGNALTVATTTLGLGDGTFISLTDTPGSYTAGSVLFTSGSEVTEDNTNLFWDDTNDRLGVGTSSPYRTLSVAGNTILDSNIITFASSSASTLTINYGAPATSTISDGQQYAWTLATSTSATPIISIDTSGSGSEGQATTTINGGVRIDSGAITHDYGSGVTSIDNLELGNLNFEDNAGVVSWVDLPVSTTTPDLTQSYTAGLDGDSILTVYGTTDGSGGVTNTAVGIGTTSPYARLSVTGTSGQTRPLFQVASSTNEPYLTITSGGNVGVGTSSPTSLFTVDGASYFAGVLNTHGQISASSTATSTFAQGINLDAGCFAVNGVCVGGGAFVSSGGNTTLNTAGDEVGIGTSSPYAKLSVQGDAGQTNPLFIVASSTGDPFLTVTSDSLSGFTIDYGTSATTTIFNGVENAWSIATGTSALAIFSIDTSGNGLATSSFNGGFDVNSGAIHYDYGANKTSIERLDLGAVTFEDDAGFVSWVDLDITSSAAAGTVEAYSAQIDSNEVLTVYGEADGNGGLQAMKVVVGTSSAALLSSTNIPFGSFVVSDGILCVDDGGDNCDDAQRFAGGLYATSTTVTAVDVAENYPTKDTDLESGDLVMLDSQYEVFVTKYDSSQASTSTSTPNAFVGVVSTAPGILLGGFGSNEFTGETEVPVTLAGRVPTKVNFEGGDIAIGDRISFSSAPGVGAKATTSAITIGTALEAYTATSSTATSTVGTILVFIDTEYYVEPSQLTIDGSGNISIGTTTNPLYKLSVGGDISATGFVNISASSTKKDIEYLEDEDIDGLIEVIRDIDLATYRYDFEEASSTPERLGLIAEDAPSEVLSADGRGVDIYKLASLTLAGVQDVDERLAKLEADLYSATSSLLQGQGGIGLLIKNYLASVGVWISDSMTTIANLVTGSLTVGSTTSPSGITLYDEVTGEPYCIRMSAGTLESSAGECNAVHSGNDTGGGDTGGGDTGGDIGGGNTGGGDMGTTTDNGTGGGDTGGGDTGTTTDSGTDTDGIGDGGSNSNQGDSTGGGEAADSSTGTDPGTDPGTDSGGNTGGNTSTDTSGADQGDGAGTDSGSGAESSDGSDDVGGEGDTGGGGDTGGDGTGTSDGSNSDGGDTSGDPT